MDWSLGPPLHECLLYHLLFAEFSREHLANFSSRLCIHYCVMQAIDLMNVNAPADIAFPGRDGWLGMAFPGYEQQNIAHESFRQKRTHDPDIVFTGILQRFTVLLSKWQSGVSVAPEALQHGLQRAIGHRQ